MLQNELASRLHNAFERFTGALRNIDNDHVYIHRGLMFVAFDKVTVATTDTVEYAFKTPATGYVHYRLAGITTSADKVDTQIFKDAVYTGGTALEINNKNQVSSNTSNVTLVKDPTFSSPGTLLPGFSSYLPGASGVGQSRSGTNGQADSEIVFEQDTTYRFVATNGSDAENIIGINFRWYEEELG